MGNSKSESTGTRCEIQELYFWLGEEAERVGFTPWQTAWLALPGKQVPLGEPFSTVLSDNLWDLYERS